ncbi:MAG: protein-L-isoaspartate(D-aspartate) O-methyltransferase [Candidatus Omnitrophica bacterium]|nr:protein-L-isoaspartate(D-aspartate) O-methyltransferase [Candidatus Omnitrophota bacterium]
MFFRRRETPSPRDRMIEEHLKGRGIRDPRVLDAFLKVPREEFVLPEHRDRAYDDCPLPIGEGQTISQPYITALMTQALEIRPTHKVLEIGTGSGYQTAILAFLAAEVFSMERLPTLSATAQLRLRKRGIENVHFRIADGSLGLDPESPFDRIVVTAAAPMIPTPLIEQLGENGILVLPVGCRETQTLMRVWKTPGGVSMEELCGCVFVPLLGQGGFEE